MVDGAVNYVVDANVFITAFNDYYSFDLVGSFWKVMKTHGDLARVVSIDRVKEELVGRGDMLSDWAKNDYAGSFISTDRPDVIYHYVAMQKWVQQRDYKDFAKAAFAQKADAWVIAYAKAAGHTVVTLEKSAPDSRKSVKIPDVCSAFGVKSVGTFEMLRTLKIRLG
jgi:hypothetical protein